MSQLLEGFRTLPPYGLGAVLVLLLYALQSEIRFGARARSHSAGVSDRGSTLAVSLAALVPVLGLVLAMKAATNPWIPSGSVSFYPACPFLRGRECCLAELALSCASWPY